VDIVEYFLVEVIVLVERSVLAGEFSLVLGVRADLLRDLGSEE